MDPISIGKIDGTEVFCLNVQSSEGLQAKVLTWGARLAQLWVSDRAGTLADILLGHDSLEDWQASQSYAGAICGRYANRIANSRFQLDGRQIELLPNEGDGHLHGGPVGFDRRHWQILQTAPHSVRLGLVSAAGEMGYPGTLQAEVEYAFDTQGRFLVTLRARTDAPTVVNLVNHAYFNMAGQGAGSILGHRLQLFADNYTPVDAALIPDGRILPVKGTCFDFTAPRRIDTEMPGPMGFDHNFCLSGPPRGDGLRACAVAEDPASGRRMQLWTDQPGVQFYTGAYLESDPPGKAGATYGPFAGFCLETQIYPDAPNHPHFPQARLVPGEDYLHRMVMDFTPAP